MNQDYEIYNGDCIPTLMGLDPESVDMAVFSPPFSSLYAYSKADADMGNSRESDDEFLLHYDFFCRALLPVIKPGRVVVTHLQQVSRFKSVHGFMGLFDIRGAVNRVMEDAGFILHGEVTVDKDPQAQSIRTKAHALAFTQLGKDRSYTRPALADYLLIHKAPGDTAVPIKNQLSPAEWRKFAEDIKTMPGSDLDQDPLGWIRNLIDFRIGQALRNDISNADWIEWARPLWKESRNIDDVALCAGLSENHARLLKDLQASGHTLPAWYGIKETDTLNTDAAKANQDERHVCPLQLPLIDRCIRLWSNKGEVVLSPFMGVGSEGVKALELYRRFVGIELNDRYFGVAERNLKATIRSRGAQLSMFG